MYNNYDFFLFNEYCVPVYEANKVSIANDFPISKYDVSLLYILTTIRHSRLF